MCELVCCSSIYALVTDRRHQLASLAKLMEGFLDDGPQFVLKLVVVVLYGIGLSTDIREYERVFSLFSIEFF